MPVKGGQVRADGFGVAALDGAGQRGDGPTLGDGVGVARKERRGSGQRLVGGEAAILKKAEPFEGQPAHEVAHENGCGVVAHLIGGGDGSVTVAGGVEQRFGCGYGLGIALEREEGAGKAVWNVAVTG